MKVICAWHPKNFGSELVMREDRAVMDEFSNVYEPLVSHSICPPCTEMHLAEGK